MTEELEQYKLPQPGELHKAFQQWLITPRVSGGYGLNPENKDELFKILGDPIHESWTIFYQETLAQYGNQSIMGELLWLSVATPLQIAVRKGWIKSNETLSPSLLRRAIDLSSESLRLVVDMKKKVSAVENVVPISLHFSQPSNNDKEIKKDNEVVKVVEVINNNNIEI